MKQFTREEVAQHSTAKSAYIIIDSIVYDITRFAALHPGGELLILEQAGKDATKEFYAYHRQEVLTKYDKFKIGTVTGESPKIEYETTTSISNVPYSESSYMQGFHSPYYNTSHVKFRHHVREFIRTVILPDAEKLDMQGLPGTLETYKKMGEFGLLACRIGPGKHLDRFKLPGEVTTSEFDYFHEMIAHEEMARVGYPGYVDSLGAGMVIGLPPVMNFAEPTLKQRVLGEVLTGTKRICLAITEPSAGSDVASISTTAVLTPDGKHYIVNGVKKWITCGHHADYFTTAVRTGDGAGGITMLLIERSPGLETKPIKTSYSPAAGTSYIIMENVKVPAQNVLGRVGGGFQVIMHNFNHERWSIIVSTNAAVRKVIEECFKWSNQRYVFGKKLIEQPVIRNKLAHMVSKLESTCNWTENLTFQMCKMGYKESAYKLGGPLALLKLRCTRVAHDVSDDACQIFGGRGITKTGMGKFVEMLQRTYKFAAILGGSEEIMADLGIRQAMKDFPNARL